MADYLLDTNHANRLIDPRHPTRLRILAALGQGDVFHITPLIIAEMVFGFSILPRAQQNRTAWQSIRPALRVIFVDEKDGLDAAGLQVALRRRGRQLQTVDAFIAACALRYDLTLLTTDGDFAHLPGLWTENWVAT